MISLKRYFYKPPNGYIFYIALLLAITPVPGLALESKRVVLDPDDYGQRLQWTAIDGSYDPIFNVRRQLNYNERSVHLIATAELPSRFDETVTCTLISPPFLVKEQFYGLLVGGGNDYNHTYATVLDAETEREVYRVTGNGGSGMIMISVDLGKIQGRNAVVKIVDHRTESPGYVAFGGVHEVDQETARTELATSKLYNMRKNRLVADSLSWLIPNMKEHHIPLAASIHPTLTNSEGRRQMIWILDLYPQAVSVDPLITATASPDEITARFATLALGDHAKVMPESTRDSVVEHVAQLMKTHPSYNLRREAAGTLAKIHTPRSLSHLQECVKTAPAEIEPWIQFAISSHGFTRTHIPPLQPGMPNECWLKGFQFYVYLPSNWNASRVWPLLVLVHGTRSSGIQYVKMLQEVCDRYGVIAIAPTFDTSRFWGYGHFGYTGSVWRPDHALIEAVTSVVPHARIAREPWKMVGHSEGAQFVTRFMLVYPHFVAKVVANGTRKLPSLDPELPFPLGLGPNSRLPDLPVLSAASWLKVPLLLAAGSEDANADQESLRHWKDSVNEYGRANSVSGAVNLSIATGGGHSLHPAWPRIEQWLFHGRGR